MTTNEIASPYLTSMIAKLDARQRGSRGYIAQVPELQGILSEITPLVSVGVSTHPVSYDDGGDTVPVEITLSLSLSRSEMKEMQEAFDRKRKEAEQGS